MPRRAALFAGLLALGACSRPLPPMRMIDVAERPERYEGRALTVDIVEPLSLAGDGFVDVDVPEVDHPLVVLSGIDPKTPRPLRAHGTLSLLGSTLFSANKDCGARCYVLRITAVEPLPREPPMQAPSLQALLAEQERWDRRIVIYEGVWAAGFEHSRLDGRIWLGTDLGTERVDVRPTPRLPAGESTEQRVRVTGILLAHPGAGYGHLGEYPMAIMASRIEGLDPKRGRVD